MAKFFVRLLASICGLVLILQAPLRAQEPETEDSSASIVTSEAPATLTLDEAVVTKLLDRVEAIMSQQVAQVSRHLMIFELSLSLVIVVAGIFLFVIQFRTEHHLERELTEWQSRQKESRDAWESSMTTSIDHSVKSAEVSLGVQIDEMVASLVKEKYAAILRQQVDEQVRQRIGDSAPERGLLLARLRRLRNEVSESLKQLDSKISVEISQALATAIQDWHTLGSLFSPKREDLLRGLQDFHAGPFVEATGQLERIGSRFQDDHQVLDEVERALKALRKSLLP